MANLKKKIVDLFKKKKNNKIKSIVEAICEKTFDQ